jgi:hypothetical protein
MTLNKPQNIGYLKRMCWMAILVQYAVEEAMDLLQDKLLYDDKN